MDNPSERVKKTPEVNSAPVSRSVRWAGVFLMLGGFLMAAFWIIFTNVHGPTSFDLNSPFLGKGTLFWGMLTSAPPNFLVALGLILLYPQLVPLGSRLARAGFNLTLIGLIVPAISDLVLAPWDRPSCCRCWASG